MYQKFIEAESEKSGHVQGIAIDNKREFVYCSFTTRLLKLDMQGNLVGSVEGLVGHLGCLAYNKENGKVYGSLEFKNDIIGADIIKSRGCDFEVKDAFYMAIFDVEKIDRLNMDAEKDGVMKTVYLQDVVADYTKKGHKYGCSGIDGTTIAPDIEKQTDSACLYVAYGIYSELERQDNDYQVILKYDLTDFESYAKPLSQRNMHTSGPEKYTEKYFVYTGNTNFGIQNLEYDDYINGFIVAVYPGYKKQFKNFPMFLIDASKAPQVQQLKGLDEQGKVLSLMQMGELDESNNVYGFRFPLGATGISSLGDGLYYFARDTRNNGVFGVEIRLYKWNGTEPFVLVD